MTLPSHSFLRSVTLEHEGIESPDEYPFSIPAIEALTTLDLDTPVTFLAGDNGTGKSTLIEAIAAAVGLNAEGGSQNFRFSTRPETSLLASALRVTRGLDRPRTGFFLRAESFFNVATEIDDLADKPMLDAYGGLSLHEQSHGESFIALITNRFGPRGLYLLDEPEAALSVTGLLALLRRMHQLVGEGSQFIAATHSPILMGFPDARIYQTGKDGFEEMAWEETPQYRLTRSFLADREAFLRHVFED